MIHPIANDFWISFENKEIHHVLGRTKVWTYVDLKLWLDEEFEMPIRHCDPYPLMMHYMGPVMINGWKLMPEAEKHLKLWTLQPLKHSAGGGLLDFPE